METLGQFLKREREFRGVALETVAKTTKISPTFLKYIESDQWNSLPKGSFVKGFLRAYAQSVGLNVNEVLTRYQEFQKGG